MMRGRIKDISRDWKTSQLIISLLTDGKPEDAERLKESDLDISLSIHREKRSLSANAYFHVLASKISEALGTGATHEKNRLIREYGQWEIIDGRIPTIFVHQDMMGRILDTDGVHFKLIALHDEMAELGFMRGSHTYNTKEMSILIEGTVNECKELEIETLSPEKIERMCAGWCVS